MPPSRQRRGATRAPRRCPNNLKSLKTLPATASSQPPAQEFCMSRSGGNATATSPTGAPVDPPRPKNCENGSTRLSPRVGPRCSSAGHHPDYLLRPLGNPSRDEGAGRACQRVPSATARSSHGHVPTRARPVGQSFTRRHLTAWAAEEDSRAAREPRAVAAEAHSAPRPQTRCARDGRATAPSGRQRGGLDVAPRARSACGSASRRAGCVGRLSPC
jgi:hypothetical protein